jgi:hypothetical protein
VLAHAAAQKLCQSSRAGPDRRAARAMLGAMRRFGDTRGQASSEYVALVALVAVVLALAAGLTSGGVGGQVLAGLQRGLCVVAGATCPRVEPSRPDLAPCPLERTTSAESLEGAIELVRLGRGGTLSAVRMSDGRVQVTLAEDTTLGGDIGLGFSLALGRRRDAQASAGIETRVVSGRSWTLPDAAAARAFVARYGAKATIGGKAVDLVRSGCSILCDAIGWRPHAALPPADAISFDRGFSGRLGASLGPAGLEASDARVLGAQLQRDGGSTWYLQLDPAAAATLFSSARLGASAQRASVLSYTFDAKQRPVTLALATVVDEGASAAIAAAGGRLSGALGSGFGRVMELEATLDLRDAGNRRAALAFTAALRDLSDLVRLQRSAAAVGRRIDRAGVINRRTYAVSSSAFALGGALKLGGQLGGGFERTREGMRLLSAETRLPGLPFLPRDDCRPPA